MDDERARAAFVEQWELQDCGGGVGGRPGRRDNAEAEQGGKWGMMATDERTELQAWWVISPAAPSSASVGRLITGVVGREGGRVLGRRSRIVNPSSGYRATRISMRHTHVTSPRPQPLYPARLPVHRPVVVRRMGTSGYCGSKK